MAGVFPRCQIAPLPDHQTSFAIDGVERLRWHFGSQYPRPFFYPFVGSAGVPLTRMGHPGAPNHDHHRSIWFAHHSVSGVDFWTEATHARIRQERWLAYEDGDDECVMAVELGWYDGHDPKRLLLQELVVALGPQNAGASETLFEIQTTFRPTASRLEFGKTNFGFFAVRVAKSLSAHFGGGVITDSEGREGEPAIFGQRARWMDYSGVIQAEPDRPESDTTEGITYFDHPSNSGHPAHWHVRSDGWMGASVCFAEPVMTTAERPLMLRYLLHAHGGALDTAKAEAVAAEFAARPAFEVIRAEAGQHRQYLARRRSAS